MKQLRLFDPTGKPILLGEELGRGGEGIVSAIHGNNTVVGKIYLKPPSAAQSKKIAVMASIGNERLYKLAAWPLTSIHNSSGNLLGFVMPRLTGQKPIFELYNPKLRLKEFPQADWRFLIHAAINTARAFAVIHDAGHVVGDVNHGNLVVSKDATVRFIDTDSFQIAALGQHWLCEVGVPTHQPPEMQGLSSYKGIIRTTHHDNFGLAVLIFNLLCLGRHPFSGQFMGRGDMPMEKAIAEFRYAFAQDTVRTQMKPPIAALPMHFLTSNVRSLFEKAFSREGISQGRPSALEWIKALEELSSKLKSCPNNRSHHFLIDGGRCPWCEIEGMSGSMLFPFVISQTHNSNFNVNDLWRQISGMKRLNDDLPDFISTSLPITPSPSINARETKRKLIKWRKVFIPLYLGLSVVISTVPSVTEIVQLPLVIFLAVIPVVMVAWLYERYKKKLCTSFKKSLEDADALGQSLSSLPPSIGSDAVFTATQLGLERWKRQYDNLEEERKQRLQALQSQHQQTQLAQKQQQLRHHLQQYSLSTARLAGINSSKMAALKARGVQTAADIELRRISGVKGIGPILTQRLIDWRNFCERSFRFKPSSIPLTSTQAIERDIILKRKKIEQQLLAGFQTLSTMRQQAVAYRQKLGPQIKQAITAYRQARADAQYLGISS